MAAATIIHGDARHLPLADNSVDAVICDPPYELTGGSGSGGFMGKKWDATGVAFDPATWREALRVLKPGGFLLAFGGMRTQHRLICAIEDAGFDIRDAIVWHMSSGFPKSLDVAKAIDKRGGNAHLANEIARAIKTARESRGWTTGQADRHFCGGTTNWTWYEGRKGVCRPPTPTDFARIVNEWPELAPLAAAVAEAEREVIGLAVSQGGRSGSTASVGQHLIEAGKEYDLTAPATDEARRWQGFGTALKPASEIICVARKPLAGKTVAQNVLAYGCGALNIDATRVGTQTRTNSSRPRAERTGFIKGFVGGTETQTHDHGRWPSNVVFSHVARLDVDGQVIGDACADGCVDGCPVAELDAQSGTLKSGQHLPSHRRSTAGGNGNTHGAMAGVNGHGYADSGTASRFFPTFRYQAKAPSRERPKVDGVAHPTCKPLTLLKFLCRLVGGQPGSLILDPFAGSGTTLEAALLEGFNAVGVEQAAEYLPLIQHRIDRATAALAAQQKAEPEAEPTLFDVA